MSDVTETNNKKHTTLLKKILLAVVIFVLGAIAYGAARFILVEKQSTHYHANFALYINGQKDEFKSFVYYEEVTACSDDQYQNPKSRVHMHDNKNNLVHVHDDAVTWSHFFSNLGYTIADNLMVTPKGLYQKTSEAYFTYILNGQKVTSITNKVIGSGDTLLINYGNESNETIQERYKNITRDAKEYNDKPDPSSCSGGDSEPFNERLIRTLFR